MTPPAPLTTAPAPDWPLAVVLLLLTALAVAASRVGGLGAGRQQVAAAVRAVLQLAAVSAVVAFVLRSTAWSLAFVALMVAVAAWTAARRLDVPAAQTPTVAAAVAAGAVPVVTLCLGSGVVPLNGPGILPLSGIVVGGAMAAAVLAGRRAFDELRARTGTYEAALAVGLDTAAATRVVTGPTAREALLPGIDQTRTVGLVTLPGAFVGVLLGGGTAAEAGAAQVLVLLGLLAAQAVTVSVLLALVASHRLLPRDLAGLPR